MTTAFEFLRAVRDTPPKTATNPSGLTANGRLLLFTLATYADPELRCWPGIDTLVEATSLSKATLHRTFPEVASWVQRTRRGREQSNVYQLRVPRPATSGPMAGVPHKDEPSTHQRAGQVAQHLKSHPETSSVMKSHPESSSVDEVSSCDSRSLTVRLMKSQGETRSPHLTPQRTPQERESTADAAPPLALRVVDQGSERRRKREASPEHQALIEHFVAVYQRARGVPPVVDAKEHVGCNRLLAGRSLDDARAIVDRGFADPFVAEKKPSLAFIAANVNAYQGVQPETPSGVRRVASAPRPEQQGNPNPVSREFELTPFDEARIAAARADREQKGRADVAATRQESEPTRAFGERS